MASLPTTCVVKLECTLCILLRYPGHKILLGITGPLECVGQGGAIWGIAFRRTSFRLAALLMLEFKRSGVLSEELCRWMVLEILGQRGVPRSHIGTQI